jgi:hypothetical protein
MSDSGFAMMRLHSREEFQAWLAREVEVREEFERLIGSDLSLDEHSLDLLEQFLLRRYNTPDEALRLTDRAVLDAAARHIGLVMVLNVAGARWDIDLNDEDNVYYRLPIIRFSDDAEECPLAMVTAAIDRRTGEELRATVENYEEVYNGGS